MITAITINWKCDSKNCGYEKLERYGPEKTNSPTIHQNPPGWVRDIAGNIYCADCSYRWRTPPSLPVGTPVEELDPSARECTYSGCKSRTGSDWDERCHEHSWRVDGGRP